MLPLALDLGHEVTALVRNPAKVLAALTSGTRSFKPLTFFTDSARNIVTAMEQSGVKR